MRTGLWVVTCVCFRQWHWRKMLMRMLMRMLLNMLLKTLRVMSGRMLKTMPCLHHPVPHADARSRNHAKANARPKEQWKTPATASCRCRPLDLDHCQSPR